MEDEIHMAPTANNPTISIEVVEATNITDGDASSELNIESSEEQLQEGSKLSDNIDSIHSIMLKEMIPVVGMMFDSEDDAHEFYTRYAYKVGFGIRLSTSHSYTSGVLRGVLSDRLFVCSAQGTRPVDKRNLYVKKHRAETRFGCGARMKIKHDLLSRKYVVAEFEANHTHVTSTPSKTHRFRSYRKISLAHNVMADIADDSGIDPKETLELLSRQAGGREHLGFIAEDYRNYLRSKRTREMKTGDTGGVLEYLQKMQSSDPGFTYAIQVDAEYLI